MVRALLNSDYYSGNYYSAPTVSPWTLEVNNASVMATNGIMTPNNVDGNVVWIWTSRAVYTSMTYTASNYFV